MIFLRKYVPIFLALMLLSYYLVLSWVMHRNGFQHSEALFLAEKARILFDARDNTLLTLGTTFPSLVFLSAVVFSLFGFPFAPILASAFFTTLLFMLLLRDFSKSNLQGRFFIPMLCLLFVFHPGLIYTGISGRGIALVLLFFYLLFRNLFIYYKTQTTFSLSLASIFLTCLVFCNYNFIWLLLAFTPFVVLVSLEGLKTAAKSTSPITQYYDSVNNTSQRRKLANRTTAIYIILFVLPLSALFLFKLLNYVHAGDWSYFLNSQYSSWVVTGSETLGNIYSEGREGLNIMSQSHVVMQGYILLLTPMMILVFIMFKGKLYELLTLIAPFILVSILLLDNQRYLTVEYYLIFLILALIGTYYYVGKKFNTRIIYPIIMVVALINIYTGILYFKRTSDKEERLFFTSIKEASKWKPQRVITEEFRMAAYISSIANNNNKVLMDDAAAYSIVAQMRSLKSIILPVNKNFLTISENPTLEAKYICIAKDNNKLKSFTVLNSFNLKRIENTQGTLPKIMFETENWALYRIDKI
jgi:hypothetical protein